MNPPKSKTQLKRRDSARALKALREATIATVDRLEVIVGSKPPPPIPEEEQEKKDDASDDRRNDDP